MTEGLLLALAVRQPYFAGSSWNGTKGCQGYLDWDEPLYWLPDAGALSPALGYAHLVQLIVWLLLAILILFLCKGLPNCCACYSYLG